MRNLHLKLNSEIKQYDLKIEEYALNSDNKSSFYKYLNSKLKSNQQLTILRSKIMAP